MEKKYRIESRFGSDLYYHPKHEYLESERAPRLLEAAQREYPELELVLVEQEGLPDSPSPSPNGLVMSLDSEYCPEGGRLVVRVYRNKPSDPQVAPDWVIAEDHVPPQYGRVNTPAYSSRSHHGHGSSKEAMESCKKYAIQMARRYACEAYFHAENNWDPPQLLVDARPK